MQCSFISSNENWECISRRNNRPREITLSVSESVTGASATFGSMSSGAGKTKVGLRTNAAGGTVTMNNYKVTSP